MLANESNDCYNHDDNNKQRVRFGAMTYTAWGTVLGEACCICSMIPLFPYSSFDEGVSSLRAGLSGSPFAPVLRPGLFLCVRQAK